MFSGFVLKLNFADINKSACKLNGKRKKDFSRQRKCVFLYTTSVVYKMIRRYFFVKRLDYIKIPIATEMFVVFFVRNPMQMEMNID